MGVTSSRKQADAPTEEEVLDALNSRTFSHDSFDRDIAHLIHEALVQKRSIFQEDMNGLPERFVEHAKEDMLYCRGDRGYVLFLTHKLATAFDEQCERFYTYGSMENIFHVMKTMWMRLHMIVQRPHLTRGDLLQAKYGGVLYHLTDIYQHTVPSADSELILGTPPRFREIVNILMPEQYPQLMLQKR